MSVNFSHQEMLSNQSSTHKGSVLINQSLNQSRFAYSRSSSHQSLNSSTMGSFKKSTFGTASRKSPFESVSIAPAPKYNIKSGIQINLCTRKGSSFSCGRKELQKSNFSYSKPNFNPGPGSYVSKKFESKKTIVIGMKNRRNCEQKFLNERAIPDNPGPGKYCLKQKIKNGGKFATQSKRFQANKENLPGPGTYNQISQQSMNSSLMSSPQCAFSKSIKRSYFDQKTSFAPGPGKYN